MAEDTMCRAEISNVENKLFFVREGNCRALICRALSVGSNGINSRAVGPLCAAANSILVDGRSSSAREPIGFSPIPEDNFYEKSARKKSAR